MDPVLEDACLTICLMFSLFRQRGRVIADGYPDGYGPDPQAVDPIPELVLDCGLIDGRNLTSIT